MMDDQRDYTEESANRAEMHEEGISERAAEIMEQVASWAKLYKGLPHGDWTENGQWYADLEFPDIRHATQFAYISGLPQDSLYPDDHNVWPISSELRDPVSKLDKPVVLTVTRPL